MTVSASSNRSNRSVRRAQLDAVRLALGLEPPGAQAQLEAAPGRDVDGDRHVGQHGRVPVGDPVTRTPPRNRRVRARSMARQIQPSSVGSSGPVRSGIEVVVGPAGPEELDVLGHLPHGGQISSQVQLD